MCRNEIIILSKLKGIHLFESELIIEDADEITWDMYNYGSIVCIVWLLIEKNNGILDVYDNLGNSFTHQINDD